LLRMLAAATFVNITSAIILLFVGRSFLQNKININANHLSKGEKHASTTAKALHEAGEEPEEDSDEQAPEASSRPGTTSDLLAAAQAGDLSAVRRLVGEGVDLHCRHHEWGQTPLSLASWAKDGPASSYPEIMRILLEKGAEPCVYGDKGWTPLHLASYHGEAERVGILLEGGADPNAPVRDGYFEGQKAIELARSQSHTEVVERLEGR